MERGSEMRAEWGIGSREAVDATHCWGLFVKQACRIGFILAAMLMVNSFAGAPAMAQQNEAAALDNRVEALYRAGKFSEAVPLAQQALAIREKALGPDHPDVAKSLNSLALLYAKQGRYADAEPLYKRSLAIGVKAIRTPAFAQRSPLIPALFGAVGQLP
jgi:tetratricopeptide (TPR) repeat protein